MQLYQVRWMLITGLLFSLPPNLSSFTIFSPLVLTELQYSGYLLSELLTQIIYVHFAKFVLSRCALCTLRRDFGFFCSVNLSNGGEFNANHNVWTRLPSLAYKNKTENQWQRKSRWWVEFLSREGGTLVTRAYIKVLTAEIYNQYMPEKNLDLLEQGPRGMIGNDDVSIVPARK